MANVLPFFAAYSNDPGVITGTNDSDGNAGTKPVSTKDVFSGINYMMALDTTNDINNLLNNSDGTQDAANSIFNKFTTFSYSGLNAGFAYQEAGHFIGYYSKNIKSPDGLTADSDAQYASVKAKMDAQYQNSMASTQDAATKKNYTDMYNSNKQRLDNSYGNVTANSANLAGISKSIMSNPTARNLIQWGAETSSSTVYGFQPYSMTDFMFCKNYGKIPNNRLITLRRYPFPISDSVRLGGNKKNKSAIPVAQAITWFGSETQNSLNNLGLFSWDMPWEFGGEHTSVISEQNIEGNEILLSDLLNIIPGVTGGKSELKDAILSAYVAFNGSDASLTQLSGYEAKIQDYQRKLYTEGPYWNRIYGPVNVVNMTSRRSRGMQTSNWQKSFNVNFHYSFRSFNGLSPKIVALDLISNFLNLTYNDAQFLGQLSRYFPKLGVKFDPTVAEAFGNLLTSWGTTFSGNSSADLMKLVTLLKGAMFQAGSKLLNNTGETATRGLQAIAMSKLGDAIPKLLSVKSALSDRPVGEWHITVGNPMNPIFVMGDLIVTNTDMKWDDEIGPDDFPTGCTFTVTLHQGKPRDKTAIERMLNLGDTKLTTGSIKTSSYDDTFGESNNKLFNQAQINQDSDKTTQDKLAQVKADKPNSEYSKFRDRLRNGYGVQTNNGSTSTNVDDNLLLLYFQRRYGHN